MFIASKFLAFLTQPLAWVALLMLTGLVSQAIWRKGGQRLGWAALLVLLLQGWEPLPDALLRQFESQYPELGPNADLTSYTGMVVLGGALEPAYVWEGHEQVALNDAAERMTVPVALMRQFPHLRLLFTGGEGELFVQGMSEAQRAQRFFDSMGIAPNRVVYESASRTTYENAVFSAALPGVDRTQRWLLVTSASHQPRAMATFRHAGWNVTAYPVDFRTGSQTPWTQYALATGARKWHTALHEAVGWLAYKLSGRA